MWNFRTSIRLSTVSTAFKDTMLRIGLLHLFVSLIVIMYTCASGIVQVGNRFLKLLNINLGVKQSSTLSPKLFNIFINDVETF